ncbi:MAG: VOC family protein, partial [Pseudomonadota bacterium]
GVNVIGPINHGVCDSIYFAGPDQMTLEVATSQTEIDQSKWIDPTVLEKVGISPDEAERYKNPDPYDGDGGAVKQPSYDPEKPHQAYPKEMYMAMLQAPDEAITAGASYAEPPVKAEP